MCNEALLAFIYLLTYLFVYFAGVFAPLSKISKPLERYKSANKLPTPARHRRIGLTAIPTKSNPRSGMYI